MKHIKTYENNNQNIFWLVVVEFSDEPEANYQVLFSDSDSSDNYIIIKVNEFRQEVAERKCESFTDEDIFLTILDVNEWLDNNWDIRIYSHRIECNNKFEFPEEYKLIANTRKYNI